MGEKVSVGQVPEAASIISHGVERAGDVVVTWEETVVALEEGIEAEEVGTGGGSGGGPFGGPGQCRAVIAMDPDCPFMDMASGSKNALVGNSGGKFEVGNGHGALATVGSDQRSANVVGKGCPPDNGWGGCGQSVKPDAAHAEATGVAGPNVRRGQGNQFTEVGRPGTKGVCQRAEVGGASIDMAIEAHAVGIATTESVLEHGEETGGTRDGKRHGAKFAQELVPFRWWPCACEAGGARQEDYTSVQVGEGEAQGFQKRCRQPNRACVCGRTNARHPAAFSSRIGEPCALEGRPGQRGRKTESMACRV
jgi:hypothetical protein